MVKTNKISMGVLILLFAIILITCIHGNVKAEGELTIPRWTVNAELLGNGNLHITEEITFKFDDKFNGVFREISLDKTSGVANIQVEELIGTASRNYIRVENAKNGDSGVFLTIDETEKIIIKIFSPSEDQERIFRISYVVKNVAVKYNDIGELYYKFLGSENKTPIDSFTVYIKLPGNDADNNVKIFAHGPLNGEIRKVSNDTYSLYVSNVPAGTFVEGRVLFPKEFIALSNNVKNIGNYSNIVDEETAYQKKLIEDKERKEATKNALGQAAFLASIFGFAIFLMFSFQFRRGKNIIQSENNIIMQGENNEAIPEDCTPAIASYLTRTIFNTNTIFATILDLFRIGFVKIVKEEEQEGLKTNEEYFVITKVKNEDDSLLNHEKYFMNWLFREMGDGQSVSTKEIEYFREHNITKFFNLYTGWKNKVKEDAVLKGYYDKSKTKYGVLLLLFSFILGTLAISTLVYGSMAGLFGLGVSILLFIYSLTLFYRQSDYGYEQYKKWIEFKKYMRQINIDFEKEDFTKYSSDISLIYALGLGVKKEVDEFYFGQERYFNETHSNGSWILWYLMFTSNSNNSFEKSMNKSFGYTSNSYSGGSHSGGGFSSGGGGGAGGGGAGGF